MKPLCLALLLLTACALLAQPQPVSSSARVSFEQRWPDVDPQWFELIVQRDGSAVYRSLPQQNPIGPPAEPYEFAFTLSPQSRQLIFSLAPGLLRFQGTLDKTKVAFTGNKTLRYDDDGGVSSAISYNYSSSPELIRLTERMQRISESIELSQTLQLQLRFDKLALDSTLRDTEASVSLHPLPEPQLLEPILTRIADDPAIMNIARQRARHILQTALSAKPR
jgi:hypothetical protein